MTPKEKANEIFKKMLTEIEWNAQPSTINGVAKACSLIAISEILKSNPTKIECDSSELNYKFWVEVKKEIEKIDIILTNDCIKK